MTDDPVTRLLKEVGAVLLRERKHEVWLLPNGQRFVRAISPSDYRSGLNNLSDLKKALGLERESKPARALLNEAKTKKRRVFKRPTVREVYGPFRPTYDPKPRLSSALNDQLKALLKRN